MLNKFLWVFMNCDALASNFTKSNTPAWIFLTFFKLYKSYQIVQASVINRQR